MMLSSSGYLSRTELMKEPKATLFVLFTICCLSYLLSIDCSTEEQIQLNLKQSFQSLPLSRYLAKGQLFLGNQQLRHSEGPPLGAVASENSLCSGVGVDLIRLGGSAADALVGTVLCVGTTSPHHSGIGGGGFMLVRAPNGTYEHVDFRESAPAAAYEDMYRDNVDGSIFGGLASGIPGELRGLEYIHKRHGRLPWSVVVQPAVGIARYGFLVKADLVQFMDYATAATPGGRNFLVEDPNWAIDFAPNGTRLGIGDVMTRKRYANTLEAIADEGVDAFYNGAIAASVIKTVQDANGTMSVKDLEEYRVVIRSAMEIDYRGFKVRSCSAPASGTVVLSTMKIIEGYENIGEVSSTNLSTHRLDEAIRFAYAQRTKMGDPDYVKNMVSFEQEVIDDITAKNIRSKISDQKTQNVSAYNPDGWESREDHGTSHVVTADASGLAITLTTTVNLLFGSHLIDPATGIILNNEMNDFSIPNVSNQFGYIPSPNNYIRPGKRPLSSIAPTIVEWANGTLYFITGAAGGSRIITATILSLWNVLDRGMTTGQALQEPRFHDQLVPNEIIFEYAFDNGTTDSMNRRGHNVTWEPALSVVNAIRVTPEGLWEAEGDPRLADSGGLVV